MSAIFIHQPLTLPQKIDSREEQHVNAGKMNIYFKTPSFAPISGLFAAKCSAFCS